MPSRRLADLLFPALLFVFLGLYVAGILAGVEPEMAMLRAAAASIVLAFVGRFATGILEDLPNAVPAKHETPDPDSSGVEIAQREQR